jgi:hypothetical protein
MARIPLSLKALARRENLSGWTNVIKTVTGDK